MFSVRNNFLRSWIFIFLALFLASFSKTALHHTHPSGHSLGHHHSTLPANYFASRHSDNSHHLGNIIGEDYPLSINETHHHHGQYLHIHFVRALFRISPQSSQDHIVYGQFPGGAKSPSLQLNTSRQVPLQYLAAPFIKRLVVTLAYTDLPPPFIS